jgi:hypothetical protein
MSTKICRIKPEALLTMMMQAGIPTAEQAAIAAGIPVNAGTQPMLRDLVQKTLTASIQHLLQYGIFSAIDDSSPHFAHFGADLLNNGAGHSVRPVAPPQVAPAPAQYFPTQAPPPFQQHQQYPPIPAAPQPLPPGAVLPGRPLPPMPPPPNMRPAQVIPPHGVPVNAPMMGSGEPPSMTEAPAPSVLD